MCVFLKIFLFKSYQFGFRLLCYLVSLFKFYFSFILPGSFSSSFPLIVCFSEVCLLLTCPILPEDENTGEACFNSHMYPVLSWPYEFFWTHLISSWRFELTYASISLLILWNDTCVGNRLSSLVTWVDWQPQWSETGFTGIPQFWRSVSGQVYIKHIKARR